MSGLDGEQRSGAYALGHRGRLRCMRRAQARSGLGSICGGSPAPKHRRLTKARHRWEAALGRGRICRPVGIVPEPAASLALCAARGLTVAIRGRAGRTSIASTSLFGKQGHIMGIGVLLLRLVIGLTLAAHGAQKLLGWFGGPGIAGTAPFLEA